MARVDLPPSRLKARRRRMYRRLALVFAGVVVVLLAIFVGFARAPFLQIGEVHIVGASTLSSSTVAAFVGEQLDQYYLWVLPKRNIFLYPKQEIQRALYARYPSLASAVVQAQNFQSIEVALVEREPRALWCESPGQCYFIDESGVVYAPAPSFSSPVYVVYLGAASGTALPKQYLTAEQFGALSALVDAIAQKISQESLAHVLVEEGDVRMQFESGFTLLFVLDEHGGDVFERFSLALGSTPLSERPLADFAYVDLRFGDKLYYKLKTE